MAGSGNENEMNRHHAILFPYPSQGHIKPFMDLAKVLSSRGFYITFVNTEFTQRRILKCQGGIPTAQSVSENSSPFFRFETVPDGLPAEHGRTLNVPELSASLIRNVPTHFEKLMEKLMHLPGVPPVTCMISDSIFSFTQNVADNFGVPRIAFWTAGACGFAAYFFGPLVIEKGYVPLKDESYFTNGYLEELITCIPGIPPLRVKDLPSFFVVTPSSVNFMFEYLQNEAQRASEAELVIFNTFEELEKPVLDALRTKVRVYTIGPLLRADPEKETNVNPFTSSLWAEETSCLDWLDGQRPCSVLYVSFGSMTVTSEEQLVEFAWGLEASKQPFLWVMRSRVRTWKDAAERAINKGGSSYNYLQKLVKEIGIKQHPYEIQTKD